MIENSNEPLYNWIKDKKILIIDKNEDSVFLEKEFLVKWWFDEDNIITISNSLDALEYLKTNTVDLIITDVFFPNINGIEMANKIKKSRIGWNPKIVLVSSVSGYWNFDMSIQRNFDMSIQKPLEWKTFSNKIYDILMEEDTLIEN
jgi:two-component system response regulator YesN